MHDYENTFFTLCYQNTPGPVQIKFHDTVAVDTVRRG